MTEVKERWQFAKEGMGYHCWDDEVQTHFRLTHIKRSRGEINGELSITTNIEGVKTRDGVMHVARFNVLSSSTRSSLAKMLEKRTPNHPEMDWFDGLEWLCQHVILSESRGETIDEVGTRPASPVTDRWLVEPLVLKGRPSMIFGPGGAGKSLVALTCGLSVACHREIIPGMAPAVTGPVLYLDWETTADVINDRIQAVAKGHGFRPQGMFYRRCVRPLADDAEELSAIVALKGIVLVIVDSAAYAMGHQGEYGDANEAVLRLHEALRLIGTSSLIVDHVNKTEARTKGGTAQPYGSAYKTNAARISWELRKAPSVEGELRINLFHAKSNDTRQLEPIGLNLDWDEGTIIFRKADVLEEEYDDRLDKMDTRDIISDLLADGAKRTPSVIARELNLKDGTVRGVLKRMKDDGQVSTEGGLYWRDKVVVQFRNPPGSRGIDA